MVRTKVTDSLFELSIPIFFSHLALKLSLPVSLPFPVFLPRSRLSLRPSVSQRGGQTSVALGKCFTVGRSLGFKWL